MATSSAIGFNGDNMSKIMLDALINNIREELRVRILERIEPDIKAAIDASMETFKTTIYAYRDEYAAQDMVKVLFEHKHVD